MPSPSTTWIRSARLLRTTTSSVCPVSVFTLIFSAFIRRFDERRSLPRRFTQHGAASDHAPLHRRVVLGGAVHQAPVVPDDELARRPAMFVGEIRMHGERVQLLDQRAPLVVVHADDVLGV